MAMIDRMDEMQRYWWEHTEPDIMSEFECMVQNRNNPIYDCIIDFDTNEFYN